MKKILVACGSGIATSTVAREALEDGLKDRGINMHDVSLDQTSIPQLHSKAKDYDLVITTAKYDEDIGVPVLNGLPFLTGVSDDEVIDKVIEILKLK